MSQSSTHRPYPPPNPLLHTRIKQYSQRLKTKSKESNAPSTWPVNPVTSVRVDGWERDLRKRGGREKGVNEQSANEVLPDGYVVPLGDRKAVVRSLPNGVCVRDTDMYRTSNFMRDPREEREIVFGATGSGGTSGGVLSKIELRRSKLREERDMIDDEIMDRKFRESLLPPTNLQEAGQMTYTQNGKPLSSSTVRQRLNPNVGSSSFKWSTSFQTNHKRDFSLPFGEQFNDRLWARRLTVVGGRGGEFSKTVGGGKGLRVVDKTKFINYTG